MNAATLTLLLAVVAGPQDLFDDLAAEEARRAPATAESTARDEPAAEKRDEKKNGTDSDAAAADADAPQSSPPSAAAPAAQPAAPPSAGAPVANPAAPLASPSPGAATAATPSAPALPIPAVAAAAGADRLPWRLIVAFGVDHAGGESLGWASELLPMTTHLRGERSLGQVAPGLAVFLAGDLWNRGLGTTETSVTLRLMEATAGVVWQLPQEGLWNWIYPYGRVGVSAGYFAARAGTLLGDDLFVPGAQVVGGVRLHFGKLHAGRRVSFYGFGEGGYALRLSRTVKLEPIDVDDEDPVLPGPAVRLGKVDLSGAMWRVGIGIAF